MHHNQLREFRKPVVVLSRHDRPELDLGPRSRQPRQIGQEPGKRSSLAYQVIVGGSVRRVDRDAPEHVRREAKQDRVVVVLEVLGVGQHMERKVRTRRQDVQHEGEERRLVKRGLAAGEADHRSSRSEAACGPEVGERVLMLWSRRLRAHDAELVALLGH